MLTMMMLTTMITIMMIKTIMTQVTIQQDYFLAEEEGSTGTATGKSNPRTRRKSVEMFKVLQAMNTIRMMMKKITMMM